MEHIRKIIKEIISKNLKKDTCNCGCHSCDSVGNPGPVLNKQFKSTITENLQYHVQNKLPIHNTTFPRDSKEYIDLLDEARYLYVREAIHLSDEDIKLLFPKKQLNESPYPLFVKKEEIADLVLDSDIKDKDRIFNFIKNGRPSEIFLQAIVKSLGKELSDFQYENPTEKKWNPNNTGNVNPSDYGSLD